MARIPPRQPNKLAGKLLEIRKNLNLSQSELVNFLNRQVDVNQSQVSAFERGARTPSLLLVLAYARLYGISCDVLIDDSAKLPAKKG